MNKTQQKLIINAHNGRIEIHHGLVYGRQYGMRDMAAARKLEAEGVIRRITSFMVQSTSEAGSRSYDARTIFKLSN